MFSCSTFYWDCFISFFFPSSHFPCYNFYCLYVLSLLFFFCLLLSLLFILQMFIFIALCVSRWHSIFSRCHYTPASSQPFALFMLIIHTTSFRVCCPEDERKEYFWTKKKNYNKKEHNEEKSKSLEYIKKATHFDPFIWEFTTLML